MADKTAERPCIDRIERFRFPDDGCIPNSAHPTLVYRATCPTHPDLAEQFDALFAQHGWTNSWRAGVYDYTHFHSNTHEVLGVASGQVKLRIGGDHGATIELQAGDVIVLPAGTGHRCEGASDDFLVVGAYPEGRDWDVCRGDPAEHDDVRARIAQVPLPQHDPVAGHHGPLVTIWM